MKKGIVHTLIYYAVCSLVFIALSIFFEQPHHAPGLNHLFLLVVLLACGVMIVVALLNILLKRNQQYHLGALIVHGCFGLGLVLTYLIGYYSQFE